MAKIKPAQGNNKTQNSSNTQKQNTKQTKQEKYVTKNIKEVLV
jgi:hypothetical protein